MANISSLTLPNGNNYPILAHGLAKEFVVTGGPNWYKFFDITSPGGTQNLTILIEDTYSLATEILCVYFNQTGSGSSAVWNANCKIMSQTQSYHAIKYILNNNNLTLYINKTTTTTGRIVFKLLNSTARDSTFFDGSSYWTLVQTAESALSNAENADICLIPVQQKGAANGVASLNESGKVPASQLDLSGKQDKITANGILKGNGAGGVSAATAGTDYGTYSKPSGGIPSSDMASAVQTSLGKADTAYQKPTNGIPKTDLASAVQTSLGKADSAYQKPSSGIPASDLASGVIPSVPSAYTSNPAMDGTASPGSSTSWAKGDHVHPHDTTKANTSDLPSVPRLRWYGQCDSAADASERTVSITGITSLSTGLVITVLMITAQNYNGSPTLNLNSLGAKSIRRRYASNQQIGKYEWQAGAVLEFYYTGSYWVLINGGHSTGSFYGLSKGSWDLPQMDGVANTGESDDYARGDHVHPHDTTKADVADMPFPSGPNDFPLMDGTVAVGSMSEYARADHVHPNDTTKANQAQLAYVETGTKASKAYLAREYFCLNGILYRTIESISKNGTFTPGTNCEQVNVGDELSSRCRSMTKGVAAGKSVDIVITGSNYGPSHGFLLISTGNSGAVMGAWLCFGLGVRYNYHVIQTLFTASSTTVSLTSTTNGKYTYTNANTTFASTISVVVLQEAGTGYLSLSDEY